MVIHIEAIPALVDNYIWILHSDSHAVVVDPGDAEPVLHYLQMHQLTLSTILLTHQHRDHIAGLPNLLDKQPDFAPLRIWGPACAAIQNWLVPSLQNHSQHCSYHVVGEGDHLPQESVLGLQAQVLHLPGHTGEHLGFLFKEREKPNVTHGKVSENVENNFPCRLFCGDSLFHLGCGKIFESLGGSYADMYETFNKIKLLPKNTQLYSAHEYTLANIRFAMAIALDAVKLRNYYEYCNQLRASLVPTLPSVLGQELELNPFMRCTSLDDFVALRLWKNQF